MLRLICLWLCEKKEYLRNFLDDLSGEETAPSCQILRGEANDDNSFVDIMSGITAVKNADSEAWTFADALARANFSMETLAEVDVDTPRLPTC